MIQTDVFTTAMQQFERVTGRIDEESIVALAEELIRAGGENPGGTEEATVVALSGALVAIGARIEVDEVAPGRSNLIARIGGDGTDAGGLLFLGHSDVVPAGSGWTGEPFEPRRWGGRLVGRGAADMKGGLAAVVVAMAAVHAEAPEIPMTLLVTVDEECDASGAQHYVATEPAGEYAGCVVAEPTGMHIITACRGATNLRLEITGASAHAGNPDDGASAILAAGDVIRTVEEDDAKLRAQPDPDLGRACWNIGAVRGGHGTSIVADHCELALDRRTLPGEEATRILSELLAGASRAIRSRNRAGTDRLSVTGSVEMIMPGFKTEPTDGFVTACQDAVQRAGGTGDTGVWTAACEGGFISQAHSVPTVVLGPGDVNCQAHQPDESVEISELLTASRTYALIALQHSNSTTP
ncbi:MULTISPECIES: M20 family metallopeptidase [Micrococcaceae]|uniref:M20 family metallopeptidase n=1 Tax=unclassified Kocuria TaxID=2649579 RepID=UPI001EDE0ED8|nr:MULTISPECIES: M20 family metallopeptidase [unclassified Kocuria]